MYGGKIWQKALRFLYPFAKTYWFIFRPTTHGVKVLVKNNSQILLIKQSYGDNFWTLPGGGMKKEEGWRDTAIREVKEETGLKIFNLNKIKSVFSEKEFKKDNIDIVIADCDDAQFIIDSFEIVDARWFSKENLPSNLSWVARQALSN